MPPPSINKIHQQSKFGCPAVTPDKYQSAVGTASAISRQASDKSESCLKEHRASISWMLDSVKEHGVPVRCLEWCFITGSRFTNFPF